MKTKYSLKQSRIGKNMGYPPCTKFQLFPTGIDKFSAGGAKLHKDGKVLKMKEKLKKSVKM